MGKFKDLTGKKFGRLTVVERALHGKRGESWWHCICDCGDTSITRSDTLRNGRSKSCGCLNKEIMSSVKKIHGFSNPQCKEYSLYVVWRSMIGRCYNQKDFGYKNYGGRGITVWPKWKTSPEKFITWCCSNGWEKGLEIDRRNNDKGYCPDNCRFVDQKTNKQNQRLIRSTNKTGFRGVYFHKKNNKYIAQSIFGGRKYYLGSYSDPVSAAISRDSFVLQTKSIVPLNFPGLKGDCK